MDGEPTFGAWLKSRRRQLDLTQKGLAHQVGCSVGTIRKMEADERWPSRQLAGLLAECLEIPQDQHETFITFARQEPYTSGVSFAALTPPDLQTPVPSIPQQLTYQATPATLRGYQLLERIGEGRFGVVYRAVQLGVRREVAIKVIQPAYANEADFIRRFEMEAQIVARLEHPHIVPLYDYWREASGAYLVMRWMRGRSLKESLSNGPWALAEAAQLINQVAGGLFVAHRQDVVHRDIKPANILLDEGGAAYLSDFGIAKDLAGDGQITQTGVTLTSPSYSTPEQALEQPITPQSDLYSLGIVIYELLTGQQPFAGNSLAAVIQKHINEPLPAVRSLQPEVPVFVDQVIQKATAKNPTDRYADALALAEAFEAAITGQSVLERDRSAIEVISLKEEITNPYRGLRPFQEADASVFFGRQALTKQLAAHLQESQFLAVVGPSGSGKSSVVKAGLIPALRDGAIAGSENWFVAQMIPGGHPLEELEAALLRVAVNPPTSLLDQLSQDDRGLLRAVKRVLPGGEEAQLLLVIDQFEELFTLVADEAERAHFLDSLVVAITEPRSPIRGVITLRADFYDQPLLHSAFGQLMRGHTEVVLPLTVEELREAIEEPARCVGVALEQGLAAAIIAEVSEQPGGLPLLQYAVTELFERRQVGQLTRAAYDEIGGVLGALGRRAEELYASLDDSKQAVTRQLFLRLVTLGEGIEDTRRRVQIAELASIQIDDVNDHADVLYEVMDEYGDYRLLTFDNDPITRGPTVEVAHEALLREWPCLRAWLAESRADVRQQRLLATAAAEWDAADQDQGFLLRGTRLDLFQGWAAEKRIALTELEQAYLTHSVAARQARLQEEAERQKRELAQAQALAQAESERAEVQARSARRLRIFALGLVGLLVLAIAASIFAFFQMREANLAEGIAQQEAANALNAQTTAEASRLEAERNGRSNLAQSLAAQASVILGQTNDAELATLLAIEAARLNWQAKGNGQWLIDNTLRQILSDPSNYFNNILRDHRDAVWTVAYSPDGQWLASAGGGSSKVHDNAIYLWAVGDPAAEPVLLEGHQSKVQSVAFSPDGRWLASGSTDDTICLWDLADLTASPTRLVGHERDINAVAFSSDGRWLASAGSDHIIRLWTVADLTAEPILLVGHQQKVSTVAFSPDGRWLASGSEDRTIRLWDVALNTINPDTEPIQLAGNQDKVNSLAFSPDGRWLASGSFDRTIRLWDVTLAATNPAAQPILLEGHQSSVMSVAFSPDGKLLASGSFQETFLWQVFAATNNQIIEPAQLYGHQDFVNTLAFRPDSQQLTSASSDTTIRLWHLGHPFGEPVPLEVHQDEIWSLAFSPDGRWLAGGAGGHAIAESIRLWKVDDLSADPIALTGYQDQIWSLAFSPDGGWLASGGPNTRICLWDSDTINKDTTAEPILLEEDMGSVSSLAISPDGQWLASGSYDGLISVWELDSVTKTPYTAPAHLSGHQGSVLSVAFSPDGHWLASGGEDRTVRLWHLRDLTAEPIVLADLHAFIFSVVFSPDGRWLAGSAWGIEIDGSICLWDLEDLSADPILLANNISYVTSIAFSPDGQWLACGDEDGIIHLWVVDDLAKEPVLLIAEHPSDEVHFSPDGRWLASMNGDGSVTLWPTLNQLVEIGCQAVRRKLTLAEWNQYVPGEAYQPICPNLPLQTGSQ